MKFDDLWRMLSLWRISARVCVRPFLIRSVLFILTALAVTLTLSALAEA